MELRPATWRDCLFVKNLHSDLPLIPHLFWFHDQLRRGWGLWIICGGEGRIGYFRQASSGEVSIAIKPTLRGIGFGTAVLSWAARHLNAWARVNVWNGASCKAFQRGGWTHLGRVGSQHLWATRMYGKIDTGTVPTDDPKQRHL